MNNAVPFNINQIIRDAREEDRAQRWQLALTGICPICQNDKGWSYIDENNTDCWCACYVCRSEAQIEAETRELKPHCHRCNDVGCEACI